VSGRGRPGQSRYKIKRTSAIPLKQIKVLVRRLDQDLTKSLIVLLCYCGFRIAEVVGDVTSKGKVLSDVGKSQRIQGILPRDWPKHDESENLWVWRKRESLPGILKRDIEQDGNLLSISSQPLKHGKREGNLELDIDLPLVDLVIRQWKETPNPEDKVWNISTFKAWESISQASDGRLYPHAFRFARANDLARRDVSIANLMAFFGWRRASTADKYIQAARSSKKVREAIKLGIAEEEKEEEENLTVSGRS
jgi:integrase